MNRHLSASALAPWRAAGSRDTRPRRRAAGVGALLGGLLRGIKRGALVVVLAWLVYAELLLQPSNQRTWEFGFETLPQVTVHDHTVEVLNIRGNRYGNAGEYVNRVFDADRITRVWFVQEPFSMPPFKDFAGIAHTYFVFDFADQAPVGISVEARREQGERYDFLLGAFNQFELIYIWGTELDLTGRRVVVEHDDIYMYPLVIPANAARDLFLRLADTTHALETQPRFYNTLTSNCTNELARAANQVKPGAVPWDLALVFPGFSDELLYRLGFVPTDLPLAELRQRVYVNDVVAATDHLDDLSARLREALDQRLAAP